MKRILAVFFLFGMVIALGACGKKDEVAVPQKEEAKSAQWKYEKKISEPIKKISDAQNDVALGDLETNAVSISLPKNSFDSATEVELSTPESVPEYIISEMDPIGAPIEISIGQPTRLNEKMTIKMKYDKDKLPAETEKWQLRVVYYDGTEWDFIKPKEVDMDAGVATFEAYHFSFFGMNKVKDDKKVTEDFIHSAAFDKVLKDQFNSTSDHVTNQIIDMTLAKMGITDQSIRGKILIDVLKDDGYKEIIDAYRSGDIVGGGQKAAILAGTKIAENVPESVFKNALSGVTGSAEDIAAVSKAAGYAAEGQYKDAAKIIGEQIADKFLITAAGKIATEVITGQIESWKNSEVEAAFNAYKNGADGKFWGYNVEPKDFDGVWTQMRGIGRQLEIEAIAKENSVREESGMPILTEKQEEAVRAKVKEAYRSQFATRLEKDAEIKKAEENLRTIIDAYKTAGFFSSSLGPVGLDKGLDYEGKLGVLTHFMAKMMKDTNRFDLSNKDGLIMDKAISINDILQGARMYFSGPDGKKQYQAFLKDRFGIDPYPKLLELTGKWNGSMTITDVILSDELKKQIAEGKAPKEEGCDFTFNFEELKGKTNPLSFTLSPTSDGGGEMTFSSGDKDNKTIPFTYSDGTIKATISEQGGVGNLNLEVSQDVSSYGAAGSFNISYKGDMLKILASVSASKGRSK